MIGWKKLLIKRINNIKLHQYIFLFIGLFLLYSYSSIESFGTPKQLVYFHMSTCSHCVKFNPVWDKFTNQYNGEILLSKIEANEAGDMLNRYNIEGFPTICLLDEQNNKKIFNGSRNVDGLNFFLKNIK